MSNQYLAKLAEHIPDSVWVISDVTGDTCNIYFESESCARQWAMLNAIDPLLAYTEQPIDTAEWIEILMFGVCGAYEFVERLPSGEFQITDNKWVRTRL